MRRAITVGEPIDAATARLAAAGIEAARADAEWLLAGLLGVGRAGLALTLARPLDSRIAERYAAAVDRRARREPLQHILGWEEFRGLRLAVTRAVLVPRAETELLVEWALDLLPPPKGRRRPLVVDVGTGSGCIACALAHERPDVAVVATEPSPGALAVARANVEALGFGRRIHLIAADLLGPLGRGTADIVVSNPPYLPSRLLSTLAPEVREWEPHVALDGGDHGLTLLRPLIAEARGVLRPGGALVLETAGGAQAATVADLARAAGLIDVAIRRDLPGIARFVAGRVPGPRRAVREGRAAVPAEAS